MAEQNKNKGFIALYRSVQDHFIWSDKPFARGQAWIDLLLTVNHRDEKTYIDGALVEVNRGEKITSLRKLGENWGWSIGKVKRFLEELESEGMIRFECDTKKTVLSVENYGFYQYSENKTEHQKNTNGTPKEHRRNTDGTQTETNNKLNKLNNENNENNTVSAHADLFDRFWKAYPKKVAKPAGEKAFKALGVTEPLLADILAGVDRWSKSEQWTKDGGQFIPNPATFLNGRRWEDQVPTGGKPKKKSANDNYQPREYDDTVLDKFVQYAVMDEEEAV